MKMCTMVKRFAALALCLLLLLQMAPVPVLAAEDTTKNVVKLYSKDADLLAVVKNGAPLRTGPGEEYPVETKAAKGAVLEKTGTALSRHLNRFYKVSYNGKTLYIYSENVKKHTHSYDTISYDAVKYHVCDCGNVTVTARQRVEVKRAQSIATAGYLGAAGVSAAADGPLPVGDLIGIGILVTAGIMDATGAVPGTTVVVNVLEDVKFSKEMVNKDGTCPVFTYRKVVRHSAGLTYMDQDCMNPVYSYAYVRAGGDVYCRDAASAAALAGLHPGGCYTEIDKNKPNYYYHYHLGTKKADGTVTGKVGGHIFYGMSPDGNVPR